MPREPQTPLQEERRLVQRILDGDEAAYVVFFRDFGSMVKAVFWRSCDPEELFQHFCVRLWENNWARLRQWDGRGSLRGFIRQVAHHQALDAYRLRMRLREDELVHDEDGQAELEEVSVWAQERSATLSTPEAAYQIQRLRARIHAALESLRDPDKDILLIAYFEQLEGPDAAARLNITHAAFRKRLERAKERLLQVVHDDFPDLHDLLNELFD
jgi:RNA polymerase sigma factor (sigma-70 family)